MSVADGRGAGRAALWLYKLKNATAGLIRLREDAAGTTLTVEYLREGKAAKVSVVLTDRIPAKWPPQAP